VPPLPEKIPDSALICQQKTASPAGEPGDKKEKTKPERKDKGKYSPPRLPDTLQKKPNTTAKGQTIKQNTEYRDLHRAQKGKKHSSWTRHAAPS